MSAVVVAIGVVAVVIWLRQQPPSIRVAAVSLVEAMVSCNEDALYELTAPEERERYDRAALGRVCRAMRDDCLGGLELVSVKSDSPHAAESGGADATFRAGDGTTFDGGADVSRYGKQPIGSVILQMRFVVINYIMAKDKVDRQTAREIFNRDYAPKFHAAGAREFYAHHTNQWYPL